MLTFTYHENAWEVKAVSALPDTSPHEPGAILLVSCYELGHQPLGVAWPRAFLERAGYAPDALDLAVEPLDEGKVRRARLITIAVPMHTALRVGVRAAERMRQLNPGCTIVLAGLYAINRSPPRPRMRFGKGSTNASEKTHRRSLERA